MCVYLDPHHRHERVIAIGARFLFRKVAEAGVPERRHSKSLGHRRGLESVRRKAVQRFVDRKVLDTF